MAKQARNDSNVAIIGEVVQNGMFAYESDGENFYEILIKVANFQTALIGNVTFLPVIISERILKNVQSCKGERIFLSGCIYSYAKKAENGRSRLELKIVAQSLSQPGDLEDQVIASMRGYLCKQPIVKKTDDGKTLVNALLCLRRDEHISDYIPMICTSTMAKGLKGISVGDTIAAIGVIEGQSSKESKDKGDLKMIMTSCKKVPPKPQN